MTLQSNSDNQKVEENKSSLKGTIFSLSVLGAVILIVYFVFFELYMSRI